VAMMDRLIRAVEADEHFWNLMQARKRKAKPSIAQALSAAAWEMARQLKAPAIFAFTRSGSTALAMARERSPSLLYALTPDVSTARSLALVWGVTPVLSPDLSDSEAMFLWAKDFAQQGLHLPSEASIVALAGIPFGVAGSTNLLKVLTV